MHIFLALGLGITPQTCVELVCSFFCSLCCTRRMVEYCIMESGADGLLYIWNAHAYTVPRSSGLAHGVLIYLVFWPKDSGVCCRGRVAIAV